FLAVPVGSLTDRWGARRVAGLGALCFFTGPALVVAFPGMGTLVVAQALMGIGQLGMMLAARTFVGLLAPSDRLEAYYGWYTTALSGGQLVGPLLAGALVDVAGFHWAFAVTAGVALLPAIFSPRLAD